MPQWSKTIAIESEKLARQLGQDLRDLVSLVDQQLGNTIIEADALIKASTPVQTSNLKNSWVTDKVDIAKVGVEVNSYITHNTAKSYDPGGNGEEYAAYVELGLPSITRPPRSRGPANMIGGNIFQIVDCLDKNVKSIT